MKKTRKGFLYEILVSTFKIEHLSISEDSIYKTDAIKKSYYYRCKFGEEKSVYTHRSNFLRLFYMALIDEETIFDIESESKNRSSPAQFTHKNALSNAYDFILSLGIHITSLSKDMYLRKEEAKYEIYSVMFSLILCVFPLLYKDKLNEYDDISDAINDMIITINQRYAISYFGNNGYGNTTEFNSVIEMGQNKADCNYFISVNIDEVDIQSVFPVHTASYIKEIKKEIERANIDDNEEKYNALIIGLSPYDPEKDYVYSSEHIERFGNENDEEALYTEEFFLYNIDIDHYNPNRGKIFYIFKLDKSKVNSLYPKARDSDELRKEIIKRGKNEIVKKFESNIEKYYIIILEYIETVLQKITGLDAKKMSSGNVDESIAEIFNIDYKETLKNLKKINYSDFNDFFCSVIIGLIKSFRINTFYPKMVDDMIDKIIKYISKDRISKHIDILKEYINSAEQLLNDITDKNNEIITELIQLKNDVINYEEQLSSGMIKISENNT